MSTVTSRTRDMGTNLGAGRFRARNQSVLSRGHFDYFVTLRLYTYLCNRVFRFTVYK